MKDFSKKIEQIVDSEIRNSDIDNWHGITRENISTHLVKPILEEYMDALDDSIVRKLWTVLEEIPEPDAGDTIYYNPSAKAFGLGLKTTEKEKMDLGIYGKFITCLNGM